MLMRSTVTASQHGLQRCNSNRMTRDNTKHAASTKVLNGALLIRVLIAVLTHEYPSETDEDGKSCYLTDSQKNTDKRKQISNKCGTDSRGDTSGSISKKILSCTLYSNKSSKSVKVTPYNAHGGHNRTQSQPDCS